MRSRAFAVALVVGLLLLPLLLPLLRRPAPTQVWLRRHPGVVPLYVENGVYLCTLRFDGAEADCVVDTGSPHLLLAGRSCRSCDDPTSLRVTKTPTETLAYGSQSSRVAWRVGVLRVGAARVPDVRAALTREMEGETQYNILGLARGALQRALAPRRFAVAMLGDRGLLAIGARDVRALRRRHYAGRVARVPLLRSARPMYAVAGALRAGAAVWSGTVLVDTGSNFLSCPPRVLDALRPSLDAHAPIALELRTVAGDALTLTFGPEIYRHAASGTLLLEDDETDVVVLGSFFMRHLALEFDDEHLGIARVVAE